MRRLFLSLRYLVLLAILFTAFSCEHRKLEDPQNTHYVRVYLDEQIKNVTYGFYDENCQKPEYERPSVLRAILADPETGKIVSEKVLRNHGDDERGHYIDGYMAAVAGTYHFMVYEFGSVVTHVKNSDNFHTMQAYTSKISDRLMQYLPATRTEIEGRIVNAPEHMFHAVDEMIVVPRSTGIDTLRSSDGDYFVASSLVLSYYIQIKVKGVEWVKTAVTVMSGMGGSTYMRCKGDLDKSDPVNLFFGLSNPLANGDKRYAKDASTVTLYATFNTFGKLPDIPTHCTLNFEFTRGDGTSQVETIDITEMFDTPLVKENQWILLDKTIEIIPPEGSGGGGMKPGVENWKDVEAEIIM